MTRSHFPDLLTGASRDAFLADVFLSLRKRRKAIRSHVCDLAVEKVVERQGWEESEKLEIECSVSHAPHTTVRLFVWEDRWVWIDARSLNKRKGWIFEITLEGSLVGGAAARVLVEAMEASITAASPASLDQVAQLEKVWRPLLALGPRPIV